jgi:hypothetical protein
VLAVWARLEYSNALDASDGLTSSDRPHSRPGTGLLNVRLSIGTALCLVPGMQQSSRVIHFNAHFRLSSNLLADEGTVVLFPNVR